MLDCVILFGDLRPLHLQPIAHNRSLTRAVCLIGPQFLCGYPAIGAAGLVEVIIYSSPDDKKKNRGFCFLEYESHKAASLAKRRLGTGRIKVWGCDIIVDWADPQEEPDESTMSKVKVLYVRNLTQDISEEKLKESFEQFGKVERVKKIKDYAFVHFEDRDNAVLAMQDLDGKLIGLSNIEVGQRARSGVERALT